MAFLYLFVTMGFVAAKSSLHLLNCVLDYFVVLLFYFSNTPKCVSLTHPVRQIRIWELPFPSCQVPHEVSPRARFSSSPGKRESLECWLSCVLGFMEC